MRQIFLLISIIILICHNLMGQFFYSENQSIYSDIKAHNVGDIITVLIVESANASRESEINKSSGSNVAAEGDIKGNLTKYLPIFGASSALSSSHSGSEDTKQNDRLTGKITATIIEKDDNGMLKIRGSRILEINGETNLMEVEGLIRLRDINTDNTVYSYNIADAKIIYKKSGLVNKIAKPGSIQRWTTWLIGVGLLALSVYGVVS